MNLTIKISRDTILKSNKASRRKAQIEAGVYGLFKNKTFIDKKKYNRKIKDIF